MNYAACNQHKAFLPDNEAAGRHVTLANLLSGYCELVGDLGGNPDALLADVGLSPCALLDPYAPIPLDAIGQLLEDTAQRLGCPDFGLRIAERQALDAVMQPLDRLCLTAPTVRDALESCSLHIGAFNSGLVMDVDTQDPAAGEADLGAAGEAEAGQLRMVDFKLVNGFALYPQFIEQLLLLTHKSIVGLSSGFARSRMIWFSHLRIGPAVAYARRFNAVIRFGQEYDAILLGTRDLEARIAGSDAELFASERQIAARLFPVRARDIDVRVRQAIFQALTSAEECSRQNIARKLGFQERTLNRHLFKKGTSFEAIRDSVRRNLAFRYLARPDLSLSDITGRLGYSELAVLSRCCQRWFGSPPRQLRQQLIASRAPHAGAFAPDRLQRSGPWANGASPWPLPRQGQHLQPASLNR